MMLCQSFLVWGTHGCPHAPLPCSTPRWKINKMAFTYLSQSSAGQGAKVVFCADRCWRLLQVPLGSKLNGRSCLSANICSLFFCLTGAQWRLKSAAEANSRGGVRAVPMASLHINVIVCLFERGRIFNVLQKYILYTQTQCQCHRRPFLPNIFPSFEP